MWDISGVPRSYACSTINFHFKRTGRRPEDFVHECYTIAVFRRVYNHMVHPMPGPQAWPRSALQPLQPPTYKAQPGRPKKVRRKKEDELNKPYKMKRSGTQLRCWRCGVEAHNQQSCKGQEDLRRYAAKRRDAERKKNERARSTGKGRGSASHLDETSQRGSENVIITATGQGGGSASHLVGDVTGERVDKFDKRRSAVGSSREDGGHAASSWDPNFVSYIYVNNISTLVFILLYFHFGSVQTLRSMQGQPE